MDYRFAPISKWPRPFTKDRKRSPFKATYDKTMKLLAVELARVEGRNGLVQLACRPGAIRKDGRPYANAEVDHPGVIVSFEKLVGRAFVPVAMPCDTFDEWEDNLRALALGLELLRAIDRYGITSHAEQYRGWAQLPPPGGLVTPPPMTVEEAAEVVAHFGGSDAALVVTHHASFDSAWRAAAKVLHPDRNNGHKLKSWDDLQAARAVLDRHHGG